MSNFIQSDKFFSEKLRDKLLHDYQTVYEKKSTDASDLNGETQAPSEERGKILHAVSAFENLKFAAATTFNFAITPLIIISPLTPLGEGAIIESMAFALKAPLFVVKDLADAAYHGVMHGVKSLIS